MDSDPPLVGASVGLSDANWELEERTTKASAPLL